MNAERRPPSCLVPIDRQIVGATVEANRASRKDWAWLRDVLNREGDGLGTRVELDEDNALTLRWR